MSAGAVAISDFQTEVVSESEREKSGEPRSMMALATDILALAKVTNTYGWDQGGSTVDARAAVNVGAKPITGRQWLEAMQLAFELHQIREVRGLGVPEAVAHPEGFPALSWRAGKDRWFTLQLRTGAGIHLARLYRIAWERKDDRGTLAGESDSVRDAVGALLSTFGRS